MPAGSANSDQLERAFPLPSCSTRTRTLAAALSVTRIRAPPFFEVRENVLPLFIGEKRLGATLDSETVSGLGDSIGPGSGFGVGFAGGSITVTGMSSRVIETIALPAP